jgi:hypothetical protein
MYDTDIDDPFATAIGSGAESEGPLCQDDAKRCLAAYGG